MAKKSLVETQPTVIPDWLKSIPLSKLSPAYYLFELLQEIPYLGSVISFPMEGINRIRKADPASTEFALLFEALYGYSFVDNHENITKAKEYVDWQTEYIKAFEAFMNFVLVLLAIYVLAHFGSVSSSQDETLAENQDTLAEVDNEIVVEPTALPPASQNAAPLTVETQPTEVVTQPTAPIARQTYTVQPGDNLTRIAQRFNVTVADLVLWNQDLIWNQDMIRVGWSLTVSP